MTMKPTLLFKVPPISAVNAGTAQSANRQDPAVAEMCVPIQSPSDILEARKKGRELAGRLGFSPAECTLITTAISELARNVVPYTRHGEIRLGTASRMGSTGIAITVSDKGPRIRDIHRAMKEGFPTIRDLGLGLPGVKRIMDEFEMISKPRSGTSISVKKWKPQ